MAFLSSDTDASAHGKLPIGLSGPRQESIVRLGGGNELTVAVHILAILEHPSKPPSTILIEQYRPPVGTTVIGTPKTCSRDRSLMSEFPAGLVDEGEDVKWAVSQTDVGM